MSLFDRLKSLFGFAPDDDSAISCHDALVLVHEYLDGELEGVSEAQVRAHFEVCERCYPHLRLESVFRETIRRAGTAERAPEHLKAKVAELLDGMS